MKKRNRNKARKRNPRGSSKPHERMVPPFPLADLLGTLFRLGASLAPLVVSFPVNYLADGKPPATDHVTARRTDRLLDALSKAMAEGDAVAVERIKGVLSKLHAQ